MRRLVLVGLLGALVAAGYVLSQSNRLHIVGRGHPYVRTYSEATSGLTGAMAAGDGQAYGALAQDPTLARPDVFVDGRNEAAYFYQRPVLGYLAWVASFGQSEWEPGAQAAVVVMGAGVAVAACGALLRRREREPLLALIVVAAPGMVASLAGLTTEPLALAFLTLGLLAWWANPHRPEAAVICFTLAALSRESSLVAVAALAMVEVTGRVRPDRSDRARRLYPLVTPFVAYIGWVVLLRARFGAWPFADRGDRLSAVLFGALVHSIPGFADPVRSWIWLVVGVVCVVVAVLRRDRDPLGAVVVAYGLFGAVLGTTVWHLWQGFSRPLLPLYAYGWIMVLTWIVPAGTLGAHEPDADRVVVSR